MALGTETDGSLVAPSTRASLYTIKPSLGLVEGTNVIPTSHRYDIAGPIGNTPKDVANLLNVLVDHSKIEAPNNDYSSSMIGGWGDISVGTLDPESWKFPESLCKVVPEADKQMVCTKTLKNKELTINVTSWNKLRRHTAKSENLQGISTKTFPFIHCQILITKEEMPPKR